MLKDNIGVHGNFTIKVIDGKTGNIVDEETSSNVILNSGLEFLKQAISNPVTTHVDYLQLGGSAAIAKVTDTPDPTSVNGELLITPSEVFPVTAYYLKPATVTFKCIINLNQGNQGGTATYREAVLMFPIPGPDPQATYYDWFARKTFNDKLKNNTLIFEINWEISFDYDAGL